MASQTLLLNISSSLARFEEEAITILGNARNVLLTFRNMTSFRIVNNSYSIVELHSQFPLLWITLGSQVSVLNRGLE